MSELAVIDDLRMHDYDYELDHRPDSDVAAMMARTNALKPGKVFFVSTPELRYATRTDFSRKWVNI